MIIKAPLSLWNLMETFYEVIQTERWEKILGLQQ